MTKVKCRFRRIAVVLATTVVSVALFAASASALTRNQAEGLANAQADSDCGSVNSFLYACVHADTSSCVSTGTNQRGVVPWWCTEIIIQRNRLSGKVRYGSRALGYGPYGGKPLVAPTWDWQAEPVT